MSRFSTPVKRPRDIDTSARPDISYGLISPALSTSSPLPSAETLHAASTVLGSPAQLSTPKLSKSPTPPKAFAPPSRLHVFAKEWSRILCPSHPMYDVGRQILDDLQRVPRLEFPVTLNCYPTPTESGKPIDLVRHVQCDLDAIVELPPGALKVDLRPCGAPPIHDGPAARAALTTCAPVAFDVPPAGERGITSAPDARLGAHYFAFAVDRTLVAGAGTLCAPRASRSRNPAVLHAVLGQVVLLAFPIEIENFDGAPRDAPLREQFRWAAAQPGATLRVLRPGDSLFIPPTHWRAMIALGHQGSSFAATIILYAKRCDEVEPGERAAKRQCV